MSDGLRTLFPDLILVSGPDRTLRWRCGCGAEDGPFPKVDDAVLAASAHDKTHRL